MALIHVFYDGQSWDLDGNSLDVGLLSDDHEIKNRVAESLNVPGSKLASFRVEKNHEAEQIDLTPPATFGRIVDGETIVGTFSKRLIPLIRFQAV